MSLTRLHSVQRYVGISTLLGVYPLPRFILWIFSKILILSIILFVWCAHPRNKQLPGVDFQITYIVISWHLSILQSKKCSSSSGSDLVSFYYLFYFCLPAGGYPCHLEFSPLGYNVSRRIIQASSNLSIMFLSLSLLETHSVAFICMVITFVMFW